MVGACALQSDFAQLPAGDFAQIGENGINLSGGQKQRVGLARAVYAAVVGEAEMLLLDDPLSAVDAHVGAHIFEQCIMGLLRARGKTVIMPVHSLQFLAQADWCVMLHPTNGTINEQGQFHELLQAGGDFAAMMSTFASVSHDDDATEAKSPSTTPRATSRSADGDSSGTSDGAGDITGEGKKSKKGTGKLMTVEERAVGSVNRSVWLYYAKACGVALSWLVIVCYVGGMGAKILTDWWMSRWSVADNSVLIEIGYEESWSPARAFPSRSSAMSCA